VPYIKQDEPLKLECQHFVECIRKGREPVTSGHLGLDVVRILEAADESLRQQGASVNLNEIVSVINGKGQAPNGNGKGHSLVANHASLTAQAGKVAA
jgi:hypothetical protein